MKEIEGLKKQVQEFLGHAHEVLAETIVEMRQDAEPPKWIERSPTVGAVVGALAKAQGKFKPVAKNKHVDFLNKNGSRTKYSYADLADVIDSCREALSQNSLALMQVINQTEKGCYLKTVLAHESGEYVATFYPLPSALSMAPQQYGSALTYARRYSVTALINVASEEDDDGQTAQANFEKPQGKANGKQNAKPKAQKKPPEKPKPKPFPDPTKLSIEEVGELTVNFKSYKGLIKEAKYEDLSVISTNLGDAVSKGSPDNPQVIEWSKILYAVDQWLDYLNMPPPEGDTGEGEDPEGDIEPKEPEELSEEMDALDQALQ